eukprot:SM000033S12314  [mRNA]  locus=s33:81073:84384:- [translate_table: standard]
MLAQPGALPTSGGIGPGIVLERGRKVIIQVLQRALASNNGLHEEAEHGEHGKAAILDLLNLELSEGLGVISKAEGIEAATRVEKETNLAQGATSNAVALYSTHKDDLAAKGSEDGLGVNQAGVAKVIKAARGEDLGASLPPNGLPEGGAALG